MSYDKPLFPSLKLSLNSKKPKPGDIVGYFGRVPVTRVHVDAAEKLIAGTAKSLRHDKGVLSEVALGTNGFIVAANNAPAYSASLEGIPYVVAYDVRITVGDFARMLSERGAAHDHFRDLIIACFGLCDIDPEEFDVTNIAPLYKLRDDFASAFGAAIVAWLSARGMKEA